MQAPPSLLSFVGTILQNTLHSSLESPVALSFSHPQGHAVQYLPFSCVSSPPCLSPHPLFYLHLTPGCRFCFQGNPDKDIHKDISVTGNPTRDAGFLMSKKGSSVGPGFISNQLICENCIFYDFCFSIQ